MKAAVYKKPGVISVEDVADPEIGPNDFLLRVGACGICGSDLHSYSQGWVAPGAIMGHEYSGQVVEVGEKVNGVAIGDRIALIVAVPCGHCVDCTTGQGNLCQNITTPTSNGAYAELVALGKGVSTFRIPDEMTWEEAAFLNPLAVAVRAVRRTKVATTEPVVVVGLGSIGLCVVQILKAIGVKEVIGIDLSPNRLELARQLGADHVLNPLDGDIVAALQELVGKGEHRGYSFTEATHVFECSGSRRVVDQAITGLVRTGGTIVMVALFEGEVSFDANSLVRKEVTIMGSYAYTAENCEEAFNLLIAKKVNVAAMITHREPLSRISEAFAFQMDKDASVKMVIMPGADI